MKQFDVLMLMIMKIVLVIVVKISLNHRNNNKHCAFVLKFMKDSHEFCCLLGTIFVVSVRYVLEEGYSLTLQPQTPICECSVSPRPDRQLAWEL